MSEPFGSFGWICRHTVLPQCNLLFSQLFNPGQDQSRAFTTLFPSNSSFFNEYNVTSISSIGDTNVLAAQRDAGTGVGASCEIPRVGQRGSVGDVALIVLSALSLFFTVNLFFAAGRRRAAVGRAEIRILLIAFAFHSVFQIITMSSVLEQGTKGLAIVSAIHISIIVVLFWILLGNAIIATQVVDDGTPSALFPLLILAFIFFVATLWISLDTAFSWSKLFIINRSHPTQLRVTALFALTLIWPAVAAVGYLLIMCYIVLRILRELKPAVLYLTAFALFAGAQVIFFVASEPLCSSSNRKVNGAFLTTLLDSAALGVLYLAWKSITEDDWGDGGYEDELWRR